MEPQIFKDRILHEKEKTTNFEIFLEYKRKQIENKLDKVKEDIAQLRRENCQCNEDIKGELFEQIQKLKKELDLHNQFVNEGGSDMSKTNKSLN